MTKTIEPRKSAGPEFDDELSDESLDRPAADSAQVCVGWCGSE
jgi:hypothetical protein